MDTYGDLVTLLLCFFVLLYSFSSVNAEKWEALVNSFSGASSVLNGKGGNKANVIPEITIPPKEEGVTPTAIPTECFEPTLIPSPIPIASPTQSPTIAPTKAPVKEPTKPAPTSSAIYDLYQELNGKLSNNPNKTSVAIENDGKEVRIRLIASILFEPGSAVLTPNANIVLTDISTIIGRYSSRIKDIHTEGHTDNVSPIDGTIESKLELAGTRAARVLQYFTEECKISIPKAYTIGYGSSVPIASNDTPEGREKNNRVDIVMIE